MEKEKLSLENYYNDDEYFSVSTWKKYDKCQEDGLTGVYNSEMSIPMLVGSYVDAYVEGTLSKFKEEHPEIISSRGATKGELKKDYINADLICEYIDNDETISKFLSGEKQTIMCGKISNVPFKIKMDSYIPDTLIADLKVLRSIRKDNGQISDFIGQWGYDVQLACYQEIVRQNTGKQLPCYIVAVTKETPTDSIIIQIPQTYLDRALYRVESTIENHYSVKCGEKVADRCGICSTCIRTKKTTELISYSDIITE